MRLKRNAAFLEIKDFLKTPALAITILDMYPEILIHNKSEDYL
jgi:hypothetical protein